MIQYHTKSSLIPSGDDEEEVDKMEFDDQEIHGDAASVDEPSTHDLPSPPFPLKKQDFPPKKAGGAASPPPTAVSPVKTDEDVFQSSQMNSQNGDGGALWDKTRSF